MTVTRGRVLKASRIAPAAAPVAWEPKSPLDDAPAAQVEVVREGGVVVAIALKCRCGLQHELELVPPAAGGPGGAS